MFLPNLKVQADDLPDRALVCGDPKRAEMIARKLENARELSFNREYRTFVGQFQGIDLAVTSHGVGSPGAAVCFEELIRGGVKYLIRVGTAGSYSGDLPPGSIVISTAAVREDGLTRQLVPPGYPAVADAEIVDALFRECVRSCGSARKGITLTLDAFYTGVEELPHAKYKKAGVLAVEMENAALFVIASLRGVQAGAILAIDGYADADLAQTYNPHTDTVAQAVNREIEIALRAIAQLREKRKDFS